MNRAQATISGTMSGFFGASAIGCIRNRKGAGSYQRARALRQTAGPICPTAEAEAHSPLLSCIASPPALMRKPTKAPAAPKGERAAAERGPRHGNRSIIVGVALLNT